MTTQSPHRIRILQIVGTMNRGGVETWLMHVLRHLDCDRFEMDFLVHTAQPGAYDDEIRSLGSRVFPCPSPRQPWRYARNFRRILALYGPYDGVHSHVHHYSGLTLRLAEEAGVPLRIAHSHNMASASSVSRFSPRGLYFTLAERWIERHATLRLAGSRDSAVALFGPAGEEGGPVRVIPCGIDLAPFRPAPDPSLRSELGLPPDARVIGHTGRFDANKNQSFLLEIARCAIEADRRIHVLMVGDGPTRPEVERKAAQMGLAGRVVFAGVRSDVPRLLLGAMDVFVVPSFFEGLCMAAIEAQTAGLPCVLSDSLPCEAEVIPRLTTRLSLSQPAARWADAVLAAPFPISAAARAEALRAMEGNRYNVRRSTVELQQLYATAAGRLPEASHAKR